MATSFTSEQKAILKKAQPVTRKWLTEKFKNNQTVSDNLFLFLNTQESNIYKTWHQQCLADMRKIKLDLSVPELYAQISDPKVPVFQALTLAQRYYSRKPNLSKQKHTAKMLSLIKQLHDRERDFYQKASARLKTEKPSTVFAKIAQEMETMSARDNEDLLYTKQSVKHVNQLRKLGAYPSVHELYQALEPRFAGNYDLYQKQIKVVIDTYSPGQDVPADIKTVCFEFIKESIPHAGYIPGQLVEYIFFNDTMSERAYQLFLDLEKMAKEQGISSYISTLAAKLARKRELHKKKPAELSGEDLRILKLKEIFKLQKN